MKTFQSMAIGGCIVAVAVIGLQAIPDLQWIVCLAAGVFGLVALVSLAFEAFMPHPAPQPVAQPVSEPLDMVLQPAQPVAETWAQPVQPAQLVADRWLQPLSQPVADRPQPLATAAQPDRNRRGLDMMARLIGDNDDGQQNNTAPWLAEKITSMVDDDPAELPGTPEPGLPLPRRAPTAQEYPLIWQVVENAASMNAAILAVYGNKDGKTHRWVSRVAEFYRGIGSGPLPLGAQFVTAVFHHRLIGTCDMPGIVAAQLGLEVDDDRLGELMAGLDQCDDCSAWYSVSAGCACQKEEVE